MARDAEEGEIRIKVIRASVDSVSLFEITDYELEVLEKGSPSSTYLNFSIFFLSVGLSFLGALSTVSVDSDRVFTVFVVLTVLGLAAGIVLLVLWNRFAVATSAVCKKIRARVPAADTSAADCDANPIPASPPDENGGATSSG